MDIYRREKEYENELKRLERAKITKNNKTLILKFHSFQLANNISKDRVVKLSYQLRNIAKWLGKDFEKATKEDIERIIKDLNIRTNLSEVTKHDYRRLIKHFYKWLKGDNEVYPPK